MTDPTKEEERHSRPFSEFLIKQNRGRSHAELSEALDEVVQAVQATGKPGTVTYQVTIKPMNKGQTDTLNITDKIAVKTPQSERAVSIFFVDDDGHLTQNDPKQMQLDLHEVPATPKNIEQLRDAK